MKKVQGIIIVVVCICIMLVGPICSYAIERSFTASLTSELAKVTFSYGTGGSRITARMDFTEEHITTGQVYSNTYAESVMGTYTEAVAMRKADLGYEYTTMDAYGLVNGTIYTSMPNITAD